MIYVYVHAPNQCTNGNSKKQEIAVALLRCGSRAHAPRRRALYKPVINDVHSAHMSVFEIAMLVCFGAAWPFSIYRSWKSKQVAGKSLPFLVVILFGYLSGAMHKIFFSFDFVIILYGVNFCMVLIDIMLYMRNRLYHTRQSAPAHDSDSV